MHTTDPLTATRLLEAGSDSSCDGIGAADGDIAACAKRDRQTRNYILLSCKATLAVRRG